MEWIVVLIIIAAVWWWLRYGKRPKPRVSNSGGTRTRVKLQPMRPEPNHDLVKLEQRWQAIATGNVNVPDWYHHPATERQLTRLKEDEIELPNKPLTKGQASDLIGLQCEPDKDDEIILRFFKVPKSEVKCETWARIRVEQLLADPAQREKWESRPATPIQREFYRWFGHKIPKGLTHKTAEEFINAQDISDDQFEEWDAYEAVLDEFEDPEFRADEEIKKVPVSTIRQAVLALRSEGQSVADLDASDVISKVLELKPELERG